MKKSCLPVQINPITAFLLRLKGKRDGRTGIPKPNDNGEWLSPKQTSETYACEYQISQIMSRCEATTAPNRQNIAVLEERNDRATEELELIEKQITDYHESPIYTEQRQGEESLDPTTLRLRRVSESGNQSESSLRTMAAKLEDELRENKITIRKLSEAIAAVERQALLDCEKCEHRMRARIAAYWEGITAAHTDKNVPPVPIFKPVSSKISYLKYHRLEGTYE